MQSIAQYVLYLAIPLILAIPLGEYIKKVMYGEPTFLSRVASPIESAIYRLLHIDENEEMNWKTYLLAILIFSGLGLILLFLLQILQRFLPNSQLNRISWDQALNTAVSFVTNTNWQSYSAEFTMSSLTQLLGMTLQNFLSATTGIAVIFAFIRGFERVNQHGLGNFWVDLTRILISILLPLNLILSILLVSGGVVQSFKPYDKTALLEPVAVDASGKILPSARIDPTTHRVTVYGRVIPDAQVISKQFLPMGAAASQVAIKQSGTNGGGFFGVNSAHPLENPNGFTNFIELISILLLPAALCFTFGSALKDKKQGYTFFVAMLLMLIVSLTIIAVSEQRGTPQLSQKGAVNLSMNDQAGGNMEGKESRFGIASSAAWATFTTATSSGSVNSMHDSYTPISGLIQLLQMQLGEVIFGGVGSGLCGMVAFAMLTVFLAGLMVGHTPEFLGKKIEPYEMKWSVLLALAPPIAILFSSGIAALIPNISQSLHNGGAHGFSELLYAYTSAGANNGSSFAGFNANTIFVNLSLAFSMLFSRFFTIIAALAIAGSMAGKKRLAVTSGTLSTTNGTFVFLLIVVILLIGALSFFPTLALGPVAEFLNGGL